MTHIPLPKHGPTSYEASAQVSGQNQQTCRLLVRWHPPEGGVEDQGQVLAQGGQIGEQGVYQGQDIVCISVNILCIIKKPRNHREVGRKLVPSLASTSKNSCG